MLRFLLGLCVNLFVLGVSLYSRSSFGASSHSDSTEKKDRVFNAIVNCYKQVKAESKVPVSKRTKGVKEIKYFNNGPNGIQNPEDKETIIAISPQNEISPLYKMYFVSQAGLFAFDIERFLKLKEVTAKGNSDGPKYFNVQLGDRFFELRVLKGINGLKYRVEVDARSKIWGMENREQTISTTVSQCDIVGHDCVAINKEKFADAFFEDSLDNEQIQFIKSDLDRFEGVPSTHSECKRIDYFNQIKVTPSQNSPKS